MANDNLGSSDTQKQYRNEGIPSSIQSQVFRLLDENPLFSPRRLCQILSLPYKQYRNYVTKLRSNWKYYHRDDSGSKCSSVHRWRGFTAIPKEVKIDRRVAVEKGVWLPSRNKNRALLFKNGLGRLVWFETGRVNLFVRSPGNLGKAKALLGRGFLETELITDIRVFEDLCDRIRFGFHAVYETNQRLPKLTITDFYDSNSFILKSGDRTHPHAYEIIVEYRRQFEKVEALIDRLGEVLGSPESPKRLIEDYSR